MFVFELLLQRKHFMVVSLGSPQQSFSGLLDTGSGITNLPCAGCVGGCEGVSLGLIHMYAYLICSYIYMEMLHKNSKNTPVKQFHKIRR